VFDEQDLFSRDFWGISGGIYTIAVVKECFDS
jgi:hypothetical protein